MALDSSFNSLHLGIQKVPILPELETNKKMYNSMEPILQEIQKSISLPNEEKSSHNVVIHKVIDTIIEEMKKVDPLFNVLFKKKLYGGSYYDGLKLHSPDEYDLDLAMSLHKKLNASIEKSDNIGFVRIRVDLEAMKQEPNYKDYRAMERMVDSGKYLLTFEFRSWFEGVLTKAKNSLQNGRGGYQFSLSKSGPAITLIIQIESRKVCVDLVPAFIFNKAAWPPSPFRKNPITTKDEFLVVPKDPPNSNNTNNSWRLSFQEQEKEIINGKNGLKDTIRLIKLLRTRQFKETTLASYYIKTVMMWFKDSVDESFWKNSRSYIFMMGLKYFNKLLQMRKIPYYWNDNYNLLIAVNDITISNWSNRMEKIIKTLERKISSSSDDLRNCLLEFLGLDIIKDNVRNQQGLVSIGQGGQVQQDEEDQSQLVMLAPDKMVGYGGESSGKVASTEKEIVPQINTYTWKCFSEFEAIGVNVTRKLERMDKIQAIHAEKLISDILRMGLFEQLTDGTAIKEKTNEGFTSIFKMEKRQKSVSLEDFAII